MNTVKTVRRDWLMKQVEMGKMEVRCELHLTDDYRFDQGNNFGKSEGWSPARIRHPKFEECTLYNGNVMDVCVDDDRLDGYMNLCEYEFSKGSRCTLNENGTYTLHVHSNLYYTLRMNTLTTI